MDSVQQRFGSSRIAMCRRPNPTNKSKKMLSAYWLGRGLGLVTTTTLTYITYIAYSRECAAALPFPPALPARVTCAMGS